VEDRTWEADRTWAAVLQDEDSIVPNDRWGSASCSSAERNCDRRVAAAAAAAAVVVVVAAVEMERYPRGH